MMQMLEDKAEATLWTAKADRLRLRLDAEGYTAAGLEDLAHAVENAHLATRRVERAEALLQRRADDEMPSIANVHGAEHISRAA